MTEHVELLQDSICAALEAEDGAGRFVEDRWDRAGGGGGRTRVMAGGRVFEKAGVNVSSSWGELDPAFARQLQGEGREFFATGLSLILHPLNPRVPTVHANWRFIQQGQKAWFGGGADLTPAYLDEEDARHFHRVLRDVCEQHEPGSYLRFKEACDRYFWIAHRGEARGVGGIFFENTGRPLEQEFAFVQDCGRAFLAGYLPIVQRRRDSPGHPSRSAGGTSARRYVSSTWSTTGAPSSACRRGAAESILVSLPPGGLGSRCPPRRAGEARLVESWHPAFLGVSVSATNGVPGVRRSGGVSVNLRPVPTDDLTLVQRVRSGDEAAFRQLVERYQKKVFAVALGMVKDREDAMDVVQEAFVKVHRSLDHFKADSSFYTWLYRITVNVCIDVIRRRGGTRSDAVEFDERVDHDLAEANLGAVSSQLGANPEKALLRREMAEKIQEALAQIPEKHRAILVLREVEGLSYEELAQVLEIPKGTVMSRLFAGRRSEVAVGIAGHPPACHLGKQGMMATAENTCPGSSVGGQTRSRIPCR
jgi:coproporphyrinogen III oxidase